MASIRLRNGSWVADIRRKGHKSISKSFPTKGKAQVWAREVEAQMDALEFKDARGLTGITVKELINRYKKEIGEIAPFRRSKTLSLDTWIKTHGELTVAELTADCLIDWVTQRAKTVSGSTIAVELAYLGVVLRTAKELWRLPVDNTITTTARGSLKYLGISAKSKHRERRPTQKEIDDICLYFTTKRRQKVPMEDLILFAIATAMRLGEILRLQWDDINPTDKTIIIRNRKHPTEKEGNDQEVPLLGAAYDIAMRQPKTNDRIFPITEGTVSSLFPRACNALDIKDLRFHDLRHEGVSRFFEQKYSIEQVALLSGHRDWKMLARYTQVKAKDLHRS
ncbi:tyrosine-type recombinase/integrase [Undibacterium macrobrachii]|uniref:Integrase n=1 Tax=Undibacterium macrobrachii TaxID=1119058 RepID=A0ABQ2X6C0_9BURK|nr:site-specific integrase [Undibacterium macrobrachii]GGX01348.1 integrase [Undibacterium macrobrachii]